MKGRGRIYFCVEYRSKLIRAEPDYACFWVFTEIRSVIGWQKYAIIDSIYYSCEA